MVSMRVNDHDNEILFKKPLNFWFLHIYFFGLFFNIMISYREYEGLQITVTGGFTVWVRVFMSPLL